MREFAAAAERRRDEFSRDLRLAWYAAAFERQTKLPPLEKLLASRAQASPAGLAAAVRQLSEQYGIPVRLHVP